MVVSRGSIAACGRAPLYNLTKRLSVRVVQLFCSLATIHPGCEPTLTRTMLPVPPESIVQPGEAVQAYIAFSSEGIEYLTVLLVQARVSPLIPKPAQTSLMAK